MMYKSFGGFDKCKRMFENTNISIFVASFLNNVREGKK